MKLPFTRFWPWFFFTAAFESLIAIIALMAVPSERGLSLSRLTMLGALSVFFILGIILGGRARRGWTLPDSAVITPLILASALLALTCSLALFVLRYLNPQKLLPYYERSSPLLWYFLAVGFQAAIFLLLLRNGFHPQEYLKHRPVLRSAYLPFLLISGLLVFISITKIGITPDSGYWGEPGAAILGWQAALSILAGLTVLLYGFGRRDFDKSRMAYIGIPVAVYVIACVLWLGVPVSVLENSFYAPITPPANMPFPYSDAGFYDYLAQSLLIGTDYLGSIPPRPLYVVFLAVLHSLFGQDYPAMIAAQTMALALFPSALYFLGRKLHSPAAGVTAAMLAIFRELVGLWISSNTRVANSKVFTTDFPTALAIVLLCLVVIWWLEKRDLRTTIAAGGAFGLLLLFRTQSLFTLPFVLILAWFAYQRKTKEWLLAGLMIGITLFLTVLPWLAHNYTVSGKLSFEDPRQMAIIYSQYSFTGNLDLSQFDPEKDSVAGRLIAFTLENPAYVVNFIAAHFLNTEIGSLLALPLIKTFDGLFEPVNLYWVGWDGSLEWYNVVLVVLYLAILAVGFSAAWIRLRWIGLVPLAFNLGYALANGISRFSAWRYNLPVDWIFYFYFAIGFMEIFGGIASLFGAKTAVQPEAIKPNRFSLGDFRLNYIYILLSFAFVGALPWFAKGLTSPRYTDTQDQLVEQLISSGYPQSEVDFFLAQPQAALLEGRMLYPRMYRKDLGMASANPWPAYAVRDFARMGFILLNDRQVNAVFVTRDLLDFPHGADTILLGCRREGYIEARLVVFEERSYQSAPLSDPCE